MKYRSRNRLTLSALVVLMVLPLAGTLVLSRYLAADECVTGAVAQDGVPVFKGFEAPRYQRHDAVLAKCVAAYNANRRAWAGATAEQAETLPELSVSQVKAQMIQESGGGDFRSVAAWEKDPLQANVPGDWADYKRYVGLRRPRHRNDGSAERNICAGIRLLVRKGFGSSAQPAANRPDGNFDDWRTALARYNGRTDRVADGVPYGVAYADRILKRAASPSEDVPIEIVKKTKISK